MSKREELQNANDSFKSSLETQLDGLKHNFDKVGKNALIVGGGLLGAYLLSNIFTNSEKKEKKKRNKAKRGKKESRVSLQDNLLTATLKEQAIVFLLGLATERLADFLKDLDTEDEKK